VIETSFSVGGVHQQKISQPFRETLIQFPPRERCVPTPSRISCHLWTAGALTERHCKQNKQQDDCIPNFDKVNEENKYFPGLNKYTPDSELFSITLSP